MPSLTLLENQGFSSTNYLLKTSKKSYIIKIFNSLHVNIKFEFQIMQKAYKKAIGAKPIFFDEENSIMVYEYINGFHKNKLKAKEIKNIALLLKKLHQIKIVKKFFNHKKNYVLCHHDLNPKNFIFSNDIKLIDWEYAGMNDCYFDLATIIVEFGLSKKDERLFLQTYFKNSYKIDKSKLYTFKIKYIKICIDWFKNQDKQKEQLKFKKKLYECNKR